MPDPAGAPLPGAPLLGEPLPVELMNTVWADRDGVHDALATAAEATAWLCSVGERVPFDVAPGDVGPVVLDLRDLRDGLRRLAAEVTGDPRAGASATSRADAVDTLNRLASAAPTSPVLVWAAGSDPIARTRAGGPGALAAVSLVAREGVALFAGVDRHRLRACLAPGCVLYFSRDHGRREWCSLACGNRARAARHYRRVRAARQSR